MAIIIKKPVLTRTDKIIVPTKKKVLFDVEAALDPEPKPEDMQYELVKTEPASNVEFSWEKTTEETKKVQEPQTEYVVVTTEEEKAPVDWFKKITNWIVAALFGAGVVVGGKTGYDALQEMEALRERNSKLEELITAKKKEDVVKATPSIEKTDPVVPIGVPPEAFTKILEAKSHYLRALRADGKVELRTGGMVGWRLNNPGTFGYADFAKEVGAIGKYSKYAVFPTIEAGIKALEIYLFNTDRFADLSINDAMIKFFSDSEEKAISIAKKISVALNKSRTRTIMRSLTADQREKVLNVILAEDRALSGETRIYRDEADWRVRGF